LTPHRIQRSRAKGWRMPAGAIYVGRPGPFGNPFDWMVFGPDASVDFFRAWLLDQMSPHDRLNTGIDIVPGFAELSRDRILRSIKLGTLRGKNLACWCALDAPCHADVLLELANR
jgi:hypothetical protein